MKWTYNALGLQPPLSWGDWVVMVAVFVLLIFAGWQAIKFARMILEVMRGE